MSDVCVVNIYLLSLDDHCNLQMMILMFINLHFGNNNPVSGEHTTRSQHQFFNNVHDALSDLAKYN